MRDDVGAEAAPRVAAVEHRGNRERRAVVHGGGSPVPVGRVRERGEGRVAPRVDAPAGTQQRGERQLVEHDDDDRARAGDAVVGDRWVRASAMLGRARGLGILQRQPER